MQEERGLYVFWILSWHGWLAVAVVLATGGFFLYRTRHEWEWKARVWVGTAVLVLAGVAGQLVSNYEGIVVGAGSQMRVSRGSSVARVPVITWRVQGGREHTVRVTWKLAGDVQPGDTLRKRIGRWYPERMNVD